MTSLSRRPETLRGAKTFDATASFYRRAGLCDRCAAMAAWGHSCGFKSVASPCRRCLDVVAAFPDNAYGEWRAFSPKNRKLSSLGTVSATGHAPGFGLSETDIHGPVTCVSGGVA